MNRSREIINSINEAKVSKDMIKQYLITALWSSTDEGGNPLDDGKGIDDFDKSAVKKAKKDLTAFVKKAGDLLDELDDTQVGHDFWLTRNGHGAGFWDREYDDEKTGKILADIALKFGEVYIYIGDDDKVYTD